VGEELADEEGVVGPEVTEEGLRRLAADFNRGTRAVCEELTATGDVRDAQ
jgi:hypothetical protein